MKKLGLILFDVVISAILLSSCGGGKSTEGSASTEEVALREVTIGKQVWMTQNLNVDTFRNGDTIPEAKTDEEWKKAGHYKQAAWCYYKNDPANGIKYGKLYNWYAVIDPRGLAPKGWHVPSDGEWTELTDYLGGKSAAGLQMKSKRGWAVDGNGTNESSFSGLPGGLRYDSGSFKYVASIGNWWSSSKRGAVNAWYRNLDYSVGFLSRRLSNKRSGFSIRCLRD